MNKTQEKEQLQQAPLPLAQPASATRRRNRLTRNLAVAAFLAVLLPLTRAEAIPIVMNFTVAGPVTGTIVWDAASPTSPIDSLISIDLSIDGHDFTLDEVDFVNLGEFGLIGGRVTGVNTISPGTNDFWIMWDVQHLTPFEFAYTSPTLDVVSVVTKSRFDQFSVTAQQAVPEPATLTLLAAGLAVGRLARRQPVYASAPRYKPG
ncbi:PEP-CTERM sorting domain-containing protein [Methylocaldum szegediense]|uniref:PEP-CTERM sorting domain-containing protein n=1 Tax=Methylocaldum szegediense TaxID=73780 RepID=UPI00040AEA1D|nr:PEP-CTERM sorting domain-containing protein [Methylocaldum szegediense]